MWTGRLTNTIRTICKQNVLAANATWTRTLSTATVNYGDISKNSSPPNSNFGNAQRRRNDSRARDSSTNERKEWKEPGGSFDKPRNSSKNFSNDDRRPAKTEAYERKQWKQPGESFDKPRYSSTKFSSDDRRPAKTEGWKNRSNSKGSTNIKHREEAKDAKDAKDTKDTKDEKDAKDVKDAKDAKGAKGAKDSKGTKDAVIDEQPIHSMAEILKNRNDSKAAVQKTATPDAFSDNALRIYDKELDLSYVKLPYDHPQLNSFMLMTKSKSHRSRKHHLMVEGRRLLIDTLEAGLPLEYLLFSRIEQLKLIKENLVRAGATPKILRVPHHDLSFWSVMTTCPGIIGIFNKPEDMSEIYDRLTKTPGASPSEGNEEVEEVYTPKITVILDQIRDPSNLGSVIRTCAAIPCEEVILTKGCADPWEAKALRGGAGGHFRIPILGPMHWSSISSILPEPEDFSLFIADNSTKGQIQNVPDGQGVQKPAKLVPYTDVSFKGCEHVVLVIGGETEGVSADAYKLLAEQIKRNSENSVAQESGHQCISIPLANGVESLNANAAASILLFEIRRQMQII